jgi:acetylornithine deacetylase/succinyl-diaminopimelate desuccinylase-like protein
MTDIHMVNESIAVSDLQKTAEIALALMMGA